MISEDGFFIPPGAEAASGAASINGPFLLQVQENNPNQNPNPNPDNPAGNNRRKRNLPRTPDPEVEVVAFSPKALMATNRFICEICNKGFQRDQNLQLHRRGHNLPWKLKQKANKDQVKKKVYVCPEESCVHHDPSRALGDLTGIKKHYSRKHGEKKWKCDKCSKKYAVMSDWKAHRKICGTRQYKCDCGNIFSRKDSFITHRAFCDALTEETMRASTNINPNFGADFISGSVFTNRQRSDQFLGFEPSSSANVNNNMTSDCLTHKPRLPPWLDHHHLMGNQINLPTATSDSFMAHSSSAVGGFSPRNLNLFASSSSSMVPKEEENRASYDHAQGLISLYSIPPSSTGNMSATALLQKAAQIGSTRTDNSSTVFATALGMMRSSSSSSSSVSHQQLAANNVNMLHQKHLFRQQMNNQLANLQDYSVANDQLPMVNSILHNGDDYGSIDGSKRHGNVKSTTSMRDFLGTLGGGAGNGGNNIGGGGGDGRVLLQEEMAYKFATMAGHQGPYMDLMR